jgi:hypothetical protein
MKLTMAALAAALLVTPALADESPPPHKTQDQLAEDMDTGAGCVAINIILSQVFAGALLALNDLPAEQTLDREGVAAYYNGRHVAARKAIHTVMETLNGIVESNAPSLGLDSDKLIEAEAEMISQQSHIVGSMIADAIETNHESDLVNALQEEEKSCTAWVSSLTPEEKQ